MGYRSKRKIKQKQNKKQTKNEINSEKSAKLEKKIKTLLPTYCKSKAGESNKSVSPLIFRELSPMSPFVRQCYREGGERGGRRRKPQAGASAWGREKRLAPASPSRLPRGTGEGGSDKVNVQTQKNNHVDGESCESEYKEKPKGCRGLDTNDFLMHTYNHHRSNSSNDNDNKNNNNRRNDKNKNGYNNNTIHDDDSCTHSALFNEVIEAGFPYS